MTRPPLRIALLGGLLFAIPADPPRQQANAPWPNEPPGLTLRSDWGLDQAIPPTGDVPIPGSRGWGVVNNSPRGSAGGWASLDTDSTAPVSPGAVYDFVYPEGKAEGTAPATVYYPYHRYGIGAVLDRWRGEQDALQADEVYVGFWWKPSAPLDLGPNGNKVAFLFNGGGATGGQQFMILLPDGRLHVLPEYPHDFRWRDPNVNATVVTLGAWHRVEWYCRLSTGTLQWWLDGVLQGSHNDVTNSVKFDMFQFSPTWGGNTGAKKHETDHYWFDHVHLSAR